MGMDIYGRNPKTKPPGDRAYRDCQTEEEREAYWKWQDSAPGAYFRSNIWGWGPLLQFIDAAVAASRLGFDTSHWGYNDGHGLETQEDCTALADAMEALLPKVRAKDWTEPTEIAVAFGTAFGIALDSTLDVERVQRFITFLRHCGGFEIC